MAHRDRARFGAIAALAGAAVALLAVVYPWALESALPRFGVRAVAAVLGAALLAGVPLRRRGGAGTPAAACALAALFALAAVSDDGRVLRLVPAAVYAGLAGAFAKSLRAPESLIERAARALVPEAPGFIGGYCRAVTALWSVVFAGCAVWIAGVGWSGSPDRWRALVGRDLWVGMAGLGVAEFLVRKTWFRYYARGGPFERLWSALFPAERTARGRRSLAAIAAWRAARNRAEEGPGPA